MGEVTLLLVQINVLQPFSNGCFEFIDGRYACSGRQEFQIRLGLRQQEDSIIEVTPFLTGQDGSKLHRTKHIYWWHLNSKEETHSVNIRNYWLIKYTLILRLHFQQKTFFLVARQSQVEQHLREIEITPEGRQLRIGLVARFYIDIILAQVFTKNKSLL